VTSNLDFKVTHYQHLTPNILETARDTDIVTMEY